MIILAVILYLLSGSFGWLYWELDYCDFTYADIPKFLLASIFGPFCFFIGYTLSDKTISKTILKKRPGNESR